jgi:hypothetical protein
VQSTAPKPASVSPMASGTLKASGVSTLSKDQVRLSDYRTITWVDASTGRSYSLTGPFPPDQLEKFKALVVKLSQ